MAEAACTTVQSPHRNTIILWFWQFQRNSFDGKGQVEWKTYSDFENEYIEEAYQRKDDEVELNDYVINFKSNLQFKKNQRSKQRPVKRDEVDVKDYVREGRFSYPDRANTSFIPNSGGMSPFIEQWREKNLEFIYDRDFPAIAQLAAQGILEEGQLLNKEFDAQRMSEQMRSCRDQREILECAIQLYTRDTFLYNLINSTLRTDDWTKIDTLGSLCYLLREHLFYADKSKEKLTVYRGSTLTEEMIDKYKQAVGKWIQWPAFTSTSKNRRVAECYEGNTLFIMTIVSGYYTRDISSLSRFPDEEEVLIAAHLHLKIDEVSDDPLNKKHVIKMGN